ncbi:Hypothetical protein NTJ_12817 [Nesidiocoris tenuis]|uniref:C2H2-type domain-containing protein n=1 Tax=Nesidiocoris tenuis TaxID=355587 RepID=A0ABN7B6H5_9HEMI|nr:Hypothetical protein NTJ_12817 [Nesidiocoris tenuis]
MAERSTTTQDDSDASLDKQIISDIILTPDEKSIQSCNRSKSNSGEDDSSDDDLGRGRLEELRKSGENVCSVECSPDVKHWDVLHDSKAPGSSKNTKSRRQSANFSCPHCDFTSRLARTLYKHVKSHANLEITNCPICEAKFDDIESLIGHVNADHKARTYSCIHCCRVFPKFGILKIHMATHKKELKFKCEKCDFKTHRRLNLQRHMKRFHSRSYKCTQCSYKTGALSRLKAHLSVHNEEKLHACALCPYKTKWERCLQQHVASKHDSTGDAYPCPLCDKKFPMLEKLKVHAEKHSLPPPDFLKI